MAEEKAAASAAPSEGGKGASGGKPIVLYAIVLLNMLGFGAFSWMFYQGKQKEAAQPKIEEVIKGEHEQQIEDKKKEEEEFVGKTIPLETFLVNLSGSRGRKLLKVNMEFEVEGEKVQAEIEKRKPQVRDFIIILLTSKTYGQIASTEGKEYLKEEIKDMVNSFLTTGKVKRVMFTEFIYN